MTTRHPKIWQNIDMISSNATSRALLKVLHTEFVKKKGSLSFADYMSQVLYHPIFGYYSNDAIKFGARGDFITAPELSPLFSRCIARQCQQVLECIGSGSILELGAGSGQMACDILLELNQFQSLPENYFIYEISPELRKRQENKIANLNPLLAKRVRWIEHLSELSFAGIILGNEFLDALPVHCFNFSKGKIFERRVIASNISDNTSDNIVDNLVDHTSENIPGIKFWNTANIDHSILSVKLHKLCQAGCFDLNDANLHYDSEINLAIDDILLDLSNCLKTGVLLFLDYGFPQAEYYHPDRFMGTLMCHHQHRTHPDPFVNLGLQDITAHVDFTAVALAAEQANLEVIGFTNQANFLLAAGLLELIDLDFSKSAGEKEIVKFRETQAIHTLTSPAEMGELFKVIALSKNFNGRLTGFNLNDRRYAL